MHFLRTELNDGVARLRRSPHPDDRARGDNVHFEENVAPERITHFDRMTAATDDVGTCLADYFDWSVQGERRDHTPCTFKPMNGPALLSATIERTQKIVRLERIDSVLQSTVTNFADLKETVSSGRRDPAIIDRFVRGFDTFEGARPAFACFRAEVAADLRQPDWLDQLCMRLGLGHWTLKAGEVAHFALMEYTVDEVFRQAALPQPFARPTVLECQNSEFFFPAPAGSGEGYAVDLDHAAGRDSIREFLHVRIDYRSGHLVRVAERSGPTTAVDLPAARNAHLDRLRVRCGRTTYGEPMPAPGSLAP